MSAARDTPISRHVGQQTGTVSIVAIYDKATDRTTIKIPAVDANGQYYVRRIVVSGNNVLDLGREYA